MSGKEAVLDRMKRVVEGEARREFDGGMRARASGGEPSARISAPSALVFASTVNLPPPVAALPLAVVHPRPPILDSPPSTVA